MLNSLKCLMTFTALGMFVLTGCSGDDEADDADSNASTSDSSDADGGHEGEGHSHGGPGEHTHGPDDSLVWEDTQTVGDLEIKLGHHSRTLHAGTTVEPAVSITRDGEPVDDAEVFNALLDADGEEVLAEEVPTVYEPETPDEPAHYAQGELAIPDDAESVTIRFRVVVDGEESTYDTVVAVEAEAAE